MDDLETILENDEMSNQGYKRTNFDEDDISNSSSPPGVEFGPSVVFKGGLTFWQKKTALERVLLVLVFALSICVLVMAIVLGSKQEKSVPAPLLTTVPPPKEKLPCLTPACVTVASFVLNAMDKNIDPCNDFYQYACGGWIKAHPIPSGHSRWGTFSVLWQENQVVMKHVIEKPLNKTASLSEHKAQDYYESCLDENKTVEELGDKPLVALMKTIGSWEISDKFGPWDPAAFDFQKTLEAIKLADIGSLFNVWVGEDDRNSSTNILQIDQGGLGLPERDYYLNKTIGEDKVITAYLDYMTQVGVLLGGEENNTRSQMTDVILFEMQLANITVPAEERRDEEKIYNKMTLSLLQKDVPFINWIHFMRSLMTNTSVNVTGSEPIVSYAPTYLQSLSTLIQDMLKTENGKRVINNYLIWHVVKTMTPYMSKPFRTARKTLTEAISGTTGGEDLWRYCITDTDNVIGFALGAMFVREAFHGDSKNMAEAMIEEVKTAFKRNLPNLSWMDNETRKAAIDKANAVIDMIGFPEYIKNSTKLNKEYEQLEIKKDEYFWNNIRNLRFALVKNLEKLRKAPKKNVWGMTPPTVNAYYTPSKNEIVFPAGILQAPFYDQDFPKSLNFGAMGVVMGHELTHGFDDQGREYDKNGNLRPWWNNQSVAAFQKRTQCMIDQYSSYKVHGENVRGKQTLGENIADNGGLKSSYHAYLDWIQTHQAEKLLPALNLTHRQLFFIGFAQVWCSSSTKEADHLQLISDPHSPAKYRVIGTLSNSKEFAEEYKCPVDSPMNPKHKCEVW